MKISSRHIFFIAAFCPFMALAATPTIADELNSQGVISVIQPQALNQRLIASVPVPQSEDSEPSTETAVPKVRAGYRVQVFDDNNVRSAQRDAQSCKKQIESHFPEYPVYVTFSSPYWRVKVGDFKTRGEAEAAMGEIKHAFPAMAKSLRIVRDRINQR
ncbi:MAG: SPOR domain-containing protein [Muribaculaceae bacterium]|nr:SPOR domain-containing protein [Muribaculaceae bacterium]